MFLKRNRRVKNGETYEYWSLVETVRTERGPRHRLVANLGKLPGLDREHRHGWESLARLLDGSPATAAARQTTFDEIGGEGESREADAPPPRAPRWAEIDVRGLRVERVRDFGEIYLALALWRRLGLHTALEKLLPEGRETVPWALTACILTIARFCGNKSELEVAERWYQDSAPEDLLGVSWKQVYNNRLYRGLDMLIEHKNALCQHLLERYQSWFGVDFEFLLYDVTRTYFEGRAAGNQKAKRGYPAFLIRLPAFSVCEAGAGFGGREASLGPEVGLPRGGRRCDILLRPRLFDHFASPAQGADTVLHRPSAVAGACFCFDCPPGLPAAVSRRVTRWPFAIAGSRGRSPPDGESCCSSAAEPGARSPSPSSRS